MTELQQYYPDRRFSNWKNGVVMEIHRTSHKVWFSHVGQNYQDGRFDGRLRMFGSVYETTPADFDSGNITMPRE